MPKINQRPASLSALPVDALEDTSSLASTRAIDPPDPLIGATLSGSYRVERLLGQGGMGRVYEARHTRIQQKRLAIKVLRAEFARNAEVLLRFQREAEAAACISHPNVVGAYDVDRTAEGLPYIACEYLEGVDLHDYLKRVGKLTLESAVPIARQLCDGLAAAHARGVIHRDLKPHNIFLVGDFTDGMPERPLVKILDFGLSKFVDTQEEQVVTKAGIVMGTPAFMPPEQARGQLADRRSDVYGVGAILYNLLTGRQPFDEANAQATVLAVMSQEPPRPRMLEPSIPEHAELVIQRAMAKNPDERYPDMAALRLALEPLLITHSMAPPALGLPAPRRAQASRVGLDVDGEPTRAARLRLLWYFGLATVLFVGSAAVVLTGAERASRLSFSRAELALFVVFATLAAASPIALWIRHVKQQIWDSTVRVLGLLAHVRSAVFSAIALYGVAWLGFRVADRVVPRFAPSRAGLFTLHADFAGWDVLLPILALVLVISVLVRRRLLQQPPRKWQPRAAALLALALPALAGAVLLRVGVRWQTRAERNEGTESAVHAAAPPPAVTVVAPSAAPETTAVPATTVIAPPVAATVAPPVAASSPPAAPVAPVASAQAPNDALRAASAEGTGAIEALAKRYPDDPAVQRALVLAYASKSTGHADALAAVAHLYELAANQTFQDVNLVLTQIAERGGPESEQALQLAATKMGQPGLELLYRLMLTRPAISQRVREILTLPSTRARMSDAFAIAFDLRVAPTCAARLPLLNRAASVGDERSFGALAAISTGANKGCGKNKKKPCKPACPQEAPVFHQTMEKISKRLQSKTG